jgi:hypothetical protein
VFIPANTTVLVDVSSPVLGAVVLEGNLLFDDMSRSDELRLQVSARAHQGFDYRWLGSAMHVAMPSHSNV